MEIGHTYKADIWSIGILICEILGGFTPFQNNNMANNPRAIMEKCRSGKLNLPKNLNPNARDLIKQLLNEDPHSRLEINEIKNHAFFKQIDWKKLKNRQVSPPFVPDFDVIKEVREAGLTPGESPFEAQLQKRLQTKFPNISSREETHNNQNGR